MDGQGRTGLFRILGMDKKEVRLARISENEAPAPAFPLVLAVGWAKNIRRGFLLEKAVELGAAGIWFWEAERSQGAPPDQGKDGWERQLVAAAKQCGTSWLPEIRSLGGPRDVIDAAAGFSCRVLCWEHEQTRIIHPDDLTHAGGTVAVLGPEGGLEQKEAQIFQAHDFSPRTLGPNILRFETAAVFLLSLRLWNATRPR